LYLICHLHSWFPFPPLKVVPIDDYASCFGKEDECGMWCERYACDVAFFEKMDDFIPKISFTFIHEDCLVVLFVVHRLFLLHTGTETQRLGRCLNGIEYEATWSNLGVGRLSATGHTKKIISLVFAPNTASLDIYKLRSPTAHQFRHGKCRLQNGDTLVL